MELLLTLVDAHSNGIYEYQPSSNISNVPNLKRSLCFHNLLIYESLVKFY
jgi:hypothetical protein